MKRSGSSIVDTAGLSLDRRQLLAGAGAAGLAFGPFGSVARAADAPKKGGTLRLGMAGGSASDTIDPRTYNDTIPICYANQIFDAFIDIDAEGKAQGRLLESWDTRPGATDWVFNVRKGIEFHSGKTLDADDVIYSLNLHRGDTKSAAKDILAAITDIKKLSPTQVGITLSGGNVDLPYMLSDYHLYVVPNGLTEWSKPDGTGAYQLESFEPGIRVLTKNTGRYWKPDSAWFDSVELKYIPDASARSQALLSGQIDAAGGPGCNGASSPSRGQDHQHGHNELGRPAAHLALTKKVLEDAGYTVKLTNFSEWGIAYAALAKGDAQLLVSQTDYIAQDYWNRNKNKLEKLSAVSFGLHDFLAVPSYVTIDSIDQMNGVADKFDNKIVGIEPGAGEMREVANVVSDYGLKLHLVEGSTAAMTAALQSAIERKEWIAVTMWEPSWMAQKFDIKQLGDPKNDFAPPQTYFWVGQKGFAEAHPHAREIIASVYLPLADDTAINAAVKDGKTMDQATDDWMKAHADLVKRWENIKKD